MTKPSLKFHHVSFEYETSTEPLLENLSFHLVSGWYGVVGINGSGKTTLLMLSTGLLEPEYGQIERPQNSYYCPQRTDYMPAELNQLIMEQSKSACIAKELLKIGNNWMDRWGTLSHGERKRAQIATALWIQPDLLAIDEPTNHLDSDARHQIEQALKNFKGIGLLVSHDRELLDSLCNHCLFIESANIIVRPGGITKGMEIGKKEEISVRRRYMHKKHLLKKIKRETHRRQISAEKSKTRRSKGGLSLRDHDAREKIDRAILTGKDGVAGKLVKQMKGRLNQVEKEMESIQIRKEKRLGIRLPGSQSGRNFLIDLSQNSIMLGQQKKLSYPDLLITPQDRIALTGPNGSGKSTLIRLIIKSLNVQKLVMTYIPQEINASQSKSILNQARSLPREKLGHLMTIISRLGSDPHRLLDSDIPSPGETRKLLLAIGITHSPHIIIMDEPTNHMDLQSILCVEKALSECPCSLLLVSHDQYFLNALANKTWRTTRDEKSENCYQLKIY